MVHRMLDSIVEKRIAHSDGPHQIELLINEQEFQDLYDDLDQESAEDLVRIYLDTKADDGRPENIRYDFQKNKHIISITADLNYLGNDYTEFMNRHRDSVFD